MASSNYLPPRKLFFLSDNSEAELVKPQPSGKHALAAGFYLYRYTLASENLNKSFPIELKQIMRLEKVNLLIINKKPEQND